ncbi:CAF17-like 4Fe-4S cluster assembly/insertion protein YgfZ [Halomonas sp. 328]|uniref:CAF17-like 4Fe-4S cluster assembly/insertion protein YgfZ n=1 Tax=Halomonas sp. 328 TaxID=2776704 RepID=UPI0018A79135|nr:folate-binding protein YgfZ [Halomonas sp. 328]MBF8222054.1 folate-binding protein YgfZ [Halomonas sp. 328]
MLDWSLLDGVRTLDADRLDFATPEPARRALDATVIAPLAHLGILEVEGSDAARFLQGQTSAQVDLADGDFAPLTCFCSAKGRMLANGQLLRRSEYRYWLILSRDLVTPLAEHLGKFAPFYKTTLTPRDDIALLGLIGQEAPALAEARLDIVPPTTWHQVVHDEALILRHPGPRPRLLIAVPEAALVATWQAFTAQALPVGNAIWRLHDIQAGLAWIRAEQADAYLPQMINWEALGGISFKKGCYTGQEVVARAHFRGQVKKRLVRAQLEGDRLPAPGAAVEDAAGKSVGDVLGTELDAYGQPEVLAVLSTKEELGPLTVEEQVLKRLKLPYALERLDPETLADQ